MPAPTKEEIKSFIVAALTTNDEASGRTSFAKVVDGETLTGELPDAMDDFVDGMSEGISRMWAQWQAQQPVDILIPDQLTVTIPSTGAVGTPSTGFANDITPQNKGRLP